MTDGEENQATAAESPWEDILGSGQLQKRILDPGDGGVDSRPSHGDVVTINLTGYLAETDTVVEENEGLQVTIGDAELVQGLNLVLSLMSLHEKAEVLIAPRFGYGSEGRDTTIPANAQLRYVVELLNVDSPPDINELSLSERLSTGETKRQRGNFWYNHSEFETALVCYRRSLEYLDVVPTSVADTSELSTQLQNAKTIVHNNMAAVQLKLGAYDAALNSVEQVLLSDPMNVKAMFRKIKVLAAQGHIEAAIDCVKHALKLEPSNQLLRKEFQTLTERRKIELQEEKRLFRQMMGETGKDSIAKPQPARNWITRRYIVWSLSSGAVALLLFGGWHFYHS